MAEVSSPADYDGAHLGTPGTPGGELAATLSVSLGQKDERTGQLLRPAYGCVLWAEQLLLPELLRRGTWSLRRIRRGGPGSVLANKSTM